MTDLAILANARTADQRSMIGYGELLLDNAGGTSLIATLQGDAPEFAAVHAFMHANGHVLYDLAGITGRPLDGALAQIDAVFVPESSPLRRDRRWAR